MAALLWAGPAGAQSGAYIDDRLRQLQQTLGELTRRIEQLQKQNQQLQQQVDKMQASYEQRIERLEKGGPAKPVPATRTPAAPKH